MLTQKTYGTNLVKIGSVLQTLDMAKGIQTISNNILSGFSGPQNGYFLQRFNIEFWYNDIPSPLKYSILMSCETV